MQEAKDQSQQSIHQPLMTVQDIKKKLKCPYGNQSGLLCANSQCQQANGVICKTNDCQCGELHEKCSLVQLQSILKSLNKHRNDIPSQIRKSFKAARQTIYGMIQQLSKLRDRLETQQQYFGLHEYQLSFLRLIKQQEFEKICGKFTSELKNTFQAKKESSMQCYQHILQDFQAKKTEFDSICKYIENNIMKYDQNEQTKKLFFDSKIVTNQDEKKLLQKWLVGSSNKIKIQSKLLFRASTYNFRASQFHKHCNGITNTLVIVKTQFDKIIGGFTPQIWQIGNYWVADKKGKGFMFSLTLKQKYECVRKQQSIFLDSLQGPVFGCLDLILGNNGNEENKCCSFFPRAYNLKVEGKRAYDPHQQTCALFSGATNGHKFKVKQYEVYQIKCM